tara:strand:- start:274 stop:675 length:402 start_codon:yes stop_codon:yes gene_type:complete
MLETKVLERAQDLKEEYCCENVFITDADAMACLGFVKPSTNRSNVYLELPAICHKLFKSLYRETETCRFGTTTTITGRVNVRVLPPETTLTTSGAFVQVKKGIWVESLSSYLKTYDSELYHAISDHLQKSCME